MKKVAFFVSSYWEIHWLHRLIAEMGWPVVTKSEATQEYARRLGFSTTDSEEEFNSFIMLYNHMAENAYASDRAFQFGKEVILLQHAWDSGLHLKPNFWNRDMSKFTHYIVGCTQDQEWLSAMYPGKVINLGMPRLDDLWEVEHSDDGMEKIYEECGTRDFFLATGSMDIVGERVADRYRRGLVNDTTKKIVFKTHPGCSPDNTVLEYFGGRAVLLPDDYEDHMKTYRLIKASSGVLSVESFLAIEASLMEKPVIFYGREELPSDFYNKDENVNQTYRVPVDMSSTLQNPMFTSRQKEIADLYLYDGKNTERVVKFLKEYAN